MNEFSPHQSDSETLETLLDEWEDIVERGHKPNPELICKDYPHLLDDFIRKTSLLAKLDDKLNEPSPAPSSQTPSKHEPPPSETLEWKSEVARLDYHAHGGLGIVFRGFDQQLHRDVAVKFIRERRRHNPLDLQRFRIEAEITSRLDHPGVAPVHGYGQTENGVPYYSMRMVEGNTLQQRIDAFHSRNRKEDSSSERSLEFRKLLSSFVSVCNTIEYAHTRGVINCDIKPGNIMLGKYGETVVLDWGCAKYIGSAGKAKSVGEESLKPLSDTAMSTNSGSTGGTPIYMSPEQHAHAEDLGTASDIYGLGVTLYRIITGVPAFSPELSLAKIRESVIRGRFRKPTEISPGTSKALEAICLKAMALAPEDRYQTAQDLANDLERFLGDEEVTAYVEPFSRRMARLMRRHRGASQVILGSIFAMVLLSSVFAVVMGQSAQRESYAKQQAIELRDRSLQLAARSAATAMALKINDAWRILEIEAGSETLRNQMQESGSGRDPAQWEAIQEWLIHQATSRQKATQATSWFLCNSSGVQVARYPLRDEDGELYSSIGEDYSWRDYFHGNGYDLSQGQKGSPQHINDINLSSVYQSTNSAELKVAFSIPIWSTEARTGEREFLGVLGYSVELASFAVLQDAAEGESRKQISALVDLRKYPGEIISNYGLILQHPRLNYLLETTNPGLLDLPRLSEPELQRIESHRSRRIEQIRESGFAASISDVLLLQNYQDPLMEVPSGYILAACEPVCVVGRSSAEFNSGWMVIVEEIEE